MADIKKETIKIIKDIIKQNKMSDEELLNLDYVDKGLLDSFELVQLITKLESHFKIQFSSDDLESKKFKTVKGVIETIEKLLSAKR